MTSIRNFLAGLEQAGVDVTEREAAEALWLAVNMATTSATRPPPVASQDPLTSGKRREVRRSSISAPAVARLAFRYPTQRRPVMAPSAPTTMRCPFGFLPRRK